MTVTVIRSRTETINGRQYADIVFSEVSQGRWETRRHVYYVNQEGRTVLLDGQSFVSEELGCNNWKNVHTVNIVERLRKQGEAAVQDSEHFVVWSSGSVSFFRGAGRTGSEPHMSPAALAQHLRNLYPDATVEFI